MKISELLSQDAVVADLVSSEKSEVLGELTDALLRANSGLNRDEIVQVLFERERLGSTGIGDGVAIPHGKLKGLSGLLLSFGRSKSGVDFDSMDGKPAHLFFLLVAPEESVGVHLKALARISKLLKDPAVRQRLLEAQSDTDLLAIVTEEESQL